MALSSPCNFEKNEQFMCATFVRLVVWFLKVILKSETGGVISQGNFEKNE